MEPPDVREEIRIGGRTVTLRTLRPADRELEAAFVRELSPESRYYRFHSGLRELTPELLHRFTHMDYPDELALCATVVEEGAERRIAGARWARAERDPARDPSLESGTGDEKLRSLKDRYSLADPSLMEHRLELGDNITNGIQTTFPTFVLQQILNPLAVRQLVPRGVGRCGLPWSIRGFWDEQDAMTELRLKGNDLAGPGGHGCVEGGGVRRAAQARVEAQDLLGGRRLGEAQPLREVPQPRPCRRTAERVQPEHGHCHHACLLHVVLPGLSAASASSWRRSMRRGFPPRLSFRPTVHSAGWRSRRSARAAPSPRGR